MPPESKKGETKKTLMLGWHWAKDYLAFQFNALCDGFLSLCHSSSKKLPHSANNLECEHENVEIGEVYYGNGEGQYYEYYYCEECDEEIESEPYEE
tara:strand:- start:2351 stop:2638 length:288 start_codon:yes stop_codon:yes gene_type:complete